MHVACRRSEQWLHRTATAWLAPATRHVSTSSAINRGLTASRDGRRVGGGMRGGRTERRTARDTDRRAMEDAAPRDAHSRVGRDGPRRSRVADEPYMARSPRPTARRTDAVSDQELDRPRIASGAARKVGEHNLVTDLSRVLRLLRRHDREDGLVSNADHKNLKADFERLVGLANRAPRAIAKLKVRLESAPTNTVSLVPKLVFGAAPRPVSETALWCRPDSTLAALFPDRRSQASQKDDPQPRDRHVNRRQDTAAERDVPTQRRAMFAGDQDAELKTPGKRKRQEAVRHAIPGQEKQQGAERESVEDDIPVSIPYTTAASTFIYGSNAVLAALRAQRRRLYHLYLHPRLSAREDNARAIERLAQQLNVRISRQTDVRLLDKMSDDRPHNGVVLEASRIPAPPLLSLAKPDRRTAVIPLELDRQSAEDVAVNGAPEAMPTLTRTWRHPLVLLLDGITDPGNVGAILRTAHFYGVDAVALATNTCAPLTSAPLAKASSGACEALRVFALPRPADFVRQSAAAGWHVYAAVAPTDDARPPELRRPADVAKNVTTAALAESSPLARHPVILMLGAEGEGLREIMKKRASHFVGIEQGPRASDVGETPDVGVDSLNVSVAAGVLVEAFMRKPPGAQELDTAGELGF